MKLIEMIQNMRKEHHKEVIDRLFNQAFDYQVPTHLRDNVRVKYNLAVGRYKEKYGEDYRGGGE